MEPTEKLTADTPKYTPGPWGKPCHYGATKFEIIGNGRQIAVAYDGSIAWQSNDPKRCDGCCAFQTHLLRSMGPTRLAFSLGNWKQQPVMVGPTAVVMPYDTGE